MKKKYFVLTAVLMLGVAFSCFAQGQAEKTYPTAGDVRVIIPKGAGGGTDTSARGLLQFMAKNIPGINFVPTNKPDGGGVTGMVETANAKADGYTLGMVTVELAMFPHQGKCPVTYKDFEAISAPIAAPAALIVPADAPYNTLDEFIQYCKKNPGKVMVGNSGMGAIWHIAAMQFEQEFDVKLKHIPYPNGTADIVAALLGGHIDGTFADPSGIKGQYEAGGVKILATMSAKRSNLYPDVPTFTELGHPLTVRAWAVLVAPKGTPENVLAVLRQAAKATYNDTEYINYFVRQGIDPTDIVGEEANVMMQQDDAMYSVMLK
jgi:tripartite-type tricarboxylate transporter receptor subunit TctC